MNIFLISVKLPMQLSTGVQHSIFSFGNDWKTYKIRCEKGDFTAVLTDLSRAFDCIPHQFTYRKTKCLWF